MDMWNDNGGFMQMQSLLKKQMIYARGAIFKEIASA